MDNIVIKGARQHNLKNVCTSIPKNKLVVFTGISGSGKSSLAFDTIYAEGQRRYVESLSSYARQFLGVMAKPDVDSIKGLQPAISIDQKSVSHNPRSTVGTITEVYDYLRLLFSRIGHPHCQKCGREISLLSISQIVDNILEILKKDSPLKKYQKFMILAPIVKDRKGEYKELFINLKQKGYFHIRIDGKIYGLNEDLVLIKTNKHTIEVVVDRITVQTKDLEPRTKNFNELRKRLTDSMEMALKLADGEVIVSLIKDVSFDFPEKPEKMEDNFFSEKFACPKCNLSIPKIEPRTFSFNSPHGACLKCSGLGSLLKIDSEMILRPLLSISEGGLVPFSNISQGETWFSRVFLTMADQQNIDIRKPIKDYSQKQLQKILYGTGDDNYEVLGKNRYGRMVKIYEAFRGIIPELERRYKESDSDFVKKEIEKYMKQEICPDCQGKRLKNEALAISINQKNISEVSLMSIKNLFEWVRTLEIYLSVKESEIAKPILKEIYSRLQFLLDVGLSYLSLDRSANTLSSGETQRIRLASQIGSGLSGVLYVLDEPSIGLHQRDNKKLIDSLKKLRDLGNSVIVVEHDREMMKSADYIFDFGPGAGNEGGKIVSSGSCEFVKKDSHSLTGQYLSNKRRILFSNLSKESASNLNRGNLIISGCREHNLKNINVSFPLGKFICITGVSGSGKSTLIDDILYHSLMVHFNPFHKQKPGFFQRIEGLENLDKVILIDQSPIGKTPRSNPATYTGAFSYIRDLFAKTKEARVLGYKPGRFSFNVKGGRCESCEGQGQIKIEMQFMPDVYITCEHCHGKRYNLEALNITYRGKNIAEILDLSVFQALDFFEFIPCLSSKLKTLADVGLSYIKLGQPAPTLSGGEAQRVKLATELAKKSTGKTLYLLDEPTTGLHFADLEKLLSVLRRLVSVGNTVIIIEHNLDVIKNSDYIIDLGPEGGEKGGEIVAIGSPQELIKNPRSYTGKFLRDIL